jgi:large subunit ribosomal protein L29
MPLPKISEARNLSDGEIAEQIIAVKKQLFQLRLQKATRQLEKPQHYHQSGYSYRYHDVNLCGCGQLLL